jgi:hypothetical protein
MSERTLPLVRILGEVKKSLDRLVETISEYQQSKGTQEKSENGTESKIAVRLPVEVTEHYRSEQNNRPIKNRRDRIRLILEIAGVLIALGLAGMTLRSLFIFNGQLQEMRNQTDISERPWLSVEAEPVNGLMFVNGRQPVFVLKLSTRNVGKSIAKDIQADAKMFPIEPGMPVAIDAAQKQGELCDHPQRAPIGLFDLFPSDKPDVRELDISSTVSDVAAQATKINFPDGSSHDFVGFYVVGCVSYRASFGTSYHQTRFAYHLIAPPVMLPDGKPIPLTKPDGSFLLNGFEVGINVPKEKMGMITELFGQNQAN